MNDTTVDNPLTLGAKRGLPLGVYLCVLFLLSVAGGGSALASLLFLIGLLMLPSLLFRWLRSTYIFQRGAATLSALWMQGIVAFMGAGLLSTTVAVAYFRWIHPSFVIDTVKNVIEVYRTSPWDAAHQAAETMSLAMAAGVLPSPENIALEMFWVTVFFGSILSLIVSLIARAVKLPPSIPTK